MLSESSIHCTLDIGIHKNVDEKAKEVLVESAIRII